LAEWVASEELEAQEVQKTGVAGVRSCRMDNRHIVPAPHFPLRKEFWAFTVDSATRSWFVCISRPFPAELLQLLIPELL